MMDKALKDAIHRAVLKLMAKDYGAVQVRSASVSIGSGSDDEPMLDFVLEVSSPSGSQGSWSTDDVFELRSTLLRLLTEEEVHIPPVVSLRPDTPDPEADDALSDEELANALDADDQA